MSGCIYIGTGNAMNYAFNDCDSIEQIDLTNTTGFTFASQSLPVGLLERSSTGDQYSTMTLQSMWDDTMGDLYTFVDHTDHDHIYVIQYNNGDLVFQDNDIIDETKGGIKEQWTYLNTPSSTVPMSNSAYWRSDQSRRLQVKRIYINTPIIFETLSSTGTAYFNGFTNCEYIYGIGNINLSNQTSLSHAFCGCTRLEHIYGLDTWDTSTINNIEYLFDGCMSLENIQDIEDWDLTITNPIYMTFHGCNTLTSIDLSSWDLSTVKSLQRAFDGCINLSTVDLGNIFTSVPNQNSNEINLVSAYQYCSKLSSFGSMFDNIPSNCPINLNNFMDNNNYQNLSYTGSIDLSGHTITGMYRTFCNCKNLSSVDMTNCNMSNGARMGGAFSGCSSLQSVVFDGINASQSSIELLGTFKDTSSLTYLDLSSIYFSNGNKSSAFLEGTGITRITLGSDFLFGNASLPLGVWERQSTGETYNAGELKSTWNSTMADTYIKVSDIDYENPYGILYTNGDLVYQMTNEPDPSRGAVVNSVICENHEVHPAVWNLYTDDIIRVYFDTNIKFTTYGAFDTYHNLEYIYNADRIDLTGQNSMYRYFSDCENLKHIYGLADMNVPEMRDIQSLFSNCKSLDNINDIESWNLQLSSDNYGLQTAFYNCDSLYTIDLSSWDLSYVSSLYNTFSSSNNLISINLGNIFTNLHETTTSRIYLNSTFMDCTLLESINDIFSNIPSLQDENIPISLDCTFKNCNAFKTRINLSNHNIYNMASAFDKCYSIKYIDLSDCIFSNAYSAAYTFRDCNKLRVLDLSNINTTNKGTSLTYTFNNTKQLAYLDLTSGFFDEGSKGASFLAGSGITKITLGSGYKFNSSTLPSGDWKRESTGEVYTAAQLKSAWNSTMADTYEKVNVIIFDGQGGNVSKRKLVKQLGETMSEGDFPTAQRTGYTFLGWYSDEEEGSELTTGDPITQSIYFAHWKKNAYTLVLHRNVDSDMDDSEIRIPLDYDELYQLPPDAFTNDNKVIKKWTTNSDGTGVSYSLDEKIVMLTSVDGAEVHLYAKWGRTQDITISFDSKGGSYVEPLVIQKGYTLTSTDFVVAGTHRDGYTFDGWWTSATSGQRWDNSSHTVLSSTILYAHWKQNPVVTFIPNGGWVSEVSLSVPYDGNLTSLPYGDDRIKKFVGFFTEPTFGDGEQLTTSTTFTEDATYYAQWGYQPTFNLAGGSYNTPFSINTVYPIAENSMITIDTLPDVKYDGHTFVRWKLADGTTVNAGDTIDVSLYPEIIAEWDNTDTVNVTFDPNGGTLSQYNYSNANNSLCMVYEMDKDTPLGYYPDAYKAVSSRRLDFLGWYDENDVLYTRDTIISNDITLYAKYLDSSMVTYKFIVPGTTYQATSAYNNSTTTVSGNRVTTVYRTKGDEFGILPGLSVYASGNTLKGICLEGWYSDPDPFNLDGTLKDGVEKLLPTTSKTTNTEWYANIVTTAVNKYDEDRAYKYYTGWLNASNTDVSNLNNNLDFHPQGISDQTASLHIHYELNSEVTQTLPVGSVRITIPKYIWKDWNGNDVGTINISSQMAQYPAVRQGMWFSYAEDGNGNYIILNALPISGNAGVDVTFSYTVKPTLVPGGAIDQNKDYVEGYPYYQTTVPVLFEIDRDIVTTYEQSTVGGSSVTTLTDNFTADVQEQNNLTLEMHTYVNPNITKRFEMVHYNWSATWGSAPEDANDYIYIEWRANYGFFYNQPFTLKLTEDTVHDGDVVWMSNDYESSPSSYSSGGTSTNNYATFVTRHPKSLLYNIPATGVKFENQARLTAIWKSGYEQELVAPASHIIYHWTYTKGEFDKSNVYGTSQSNASQNGFGSFADYGTGVSYIVDGQNRILDNKDLWMEWELHYDGISADTPILWDDETQTYSRMQRVISMSDGVHGDIMYSSGKPAAKYVWEPTTGNIALSDNDYTINAIRIFINEYDGSYVNGEWGGPTIRSDYGLWKDISIYVRYKGSDNLVYYTSVRPWASGSALVGKPGQYGYTTVTLPSNVVGWEIRYPTKYFRTVVKVHERVAIHPTAEIKKYILDDINGGYYSEFKNRAYCNIWTSDDPFENPDTWSIRYALRNFTDDTEPEHDIFFHVTDWTGGFNGANKEIYELRNVPGTLRVSKYAASRSNVVFDVGEGVQDDAMDIVATNYVASGIVKPIKTGTFYDLLPRGATVDLNTLFGIGEVRNSNSSASSYANSYNNYKNSSNRFSRDYYSVRFEENWKDSGRTMMIIDFDISDRPSVNTVHFLYLLRMTYDDVVSYGTSVENDVAFVDTTYGNNYSTLTPTITTLGNNAAFYNEIDLLNDNVVYAKANTDYIPVDAYSWGFYKSVHTQDDFSQNENTIPNNIYTYKLSYSQSDIASVDSLVFFDVLERGAYDNAFHDGTLEAVSEWCGTFESIDISPLTTLKKDGSTTSNPIYCAPVVYYSTKAKDQFTGSDWYTSNTATWTTVMPPKADITAIAVDCTKASNGTDFVMRGKNNAVFYINMRSSVDPADIGKTTVNQAMSRANVNGDQYEGTSDTSVTLLDDTPEIHKTSSPASGTADNPCLVIIGDDLEYYIRVINTNDEFAIPNIVIEDDLPNAFLPDMDNIRVTFNQTTLISTSPRINMVKRGSKIIFTIESLDQSEECTITIPGKAGGVMGEIIENTATITSVNGIVKEIDSETTYHKTQLALRFYKVSDTGERLGGATIRLINIDDQDNETIIDDWDTSVGNTGYTRYPLEPGNYIVKEIETPEGYATINDLEFELLIDGTIEYTNGTTDDKVLIVDRELTSVRGTKVWKFDHEEDRPQSVNIRLMRKGENDSVPVYTGTYQTVTVQENWEYEFTDLFKYDENGHEYVYSVDEEPVTGYYPTYMTSPVTNGLEIKFSSLSKTYDASDVIVLYYDYHGKYFGKELYGNPGTSNCPSGETIQIPSDEFWIAFYSNGTRTSYGFKIDQITPIEIDDSRPAYDRVIPPSWVSYTDAEEYRGGRYPESDHDYNNYEELLMHYKRNMIGSVYDVINVPVNTGFDVPINKLNEENEKIGGVTLRLTSIQIDGGADIQPIEWVTVAGTTHTEHLYPGRYLLHEVSPAEGYLIADDIEFEVNGLGEIFVDGVEQSSIDMVDMYIMQPYPFSKVWFDNGYESYRPSSVTFNLIRKSDSEIIDTITLTDADAVDSDAWEGVFDPVPMVDANYDPIEYYVEEVTNGLDYLTYTGPSEVNGFYVTFTPGSHLRSGAKLYIGVFNIYPILGIIIVLLFMLMLQIQITSTSV